MNGDGATPLVSVIVPVYGVERYLDACVEGLVGQTYRPSIGVVRFARLTR